MSDPDPHSCWLGGKVPDHAHDAAQAVRAIIHLTLLPHPIPAPDVYQTLAELEDLAFALDRVLRHHLGRALEASLTDLRGLRHAATRRPRSTTPATASTRPPPTSSPPACALAAARAAIADQGYHTDTPAAVTR